jgi:hypothetical protein
MGKENATTSSVAEHYQIDYREVDTLSSVDGYFVAHGSLYVVIVSSQLPSDRKDYVRRSLLAQLRRPDHSPIGFYQDGETASYLGKPYGGTWQVAWNDEG